MRPANPPTGPADHAGLTSESERRTARLSAKLARVVIEHARTEAPLEACGVLVGRATAADGGVPTRYVRLTNAAASSYRYAIDADEQLALMLAAEAVGEVIWGIVHSHVSSPAVPSATDIELAFYPASLYVICSLGSHPPQIRAWSICDGAALEVVLR